MRRRDVTESLLMFDQPTNSDPESVESAKEQPQLQNVSIDQAAVYAHLAAIRRQRYSSVMHRLQPSDGYKAQLPANDGHSQIEQMHGIRRAILNFKQQRAVKLEWIDFSAGFLAGVTGVIVGHPFDTIKVRQQVKSGSEYSSLYMCMRNTCKQEGLRGFYKGLLFPLLTEGGRNCLFFGVYERVKERGRNDGQMGINYWSVGVAGAIGGAVQALPATPIELTKIKLQQQTERIKSERQYRGPVHCMSDIYRRHGIRACFRGISTCVLRDLTGFAAYMTSYEFLCRLFDPRGPGYCSLPALLLTGGTAGAISWFINLPIDYVKSRLQADCLRQPRFSNTYECTCTVLREEGMRVFYRGLPAVLMRAFLLNAVTLTVYSMGRQRLLNVCAEDGWT